MRGPICKVCASPMRTQIDADMLGGMSLRRVEAKYGYKHTTLHNHKIRCQGIPASKERPTPHTPESDARARQKRKELAAPSRVAAMEAMLPSREELGATLGSVIERLDAIVAKNERDDGVDVVAISGLSGIRQTVADLARLAGHVGGASTQNINVGVAVSVSAGDIAAALAQHLVTVQPSKLIEVTADEP